MLSFLREDVERRLDCHVLLWSVAMNMIDTLTHFQDSSTIFRSSSQKLLPLSLTN